MSSRDGELQQDDPDSQGDHVGEEKNLDVSIENEEFDVDDDEESESDEDDDGEESDSDDDGDEDEEGEDEETENAGEGVSEEDNEDEDDEDDDEESDEGDDDEEAEQGEEADNADDSSSGDENCDRCPICLNRLRVQDIGTPESCDHAFCLECIQEWAKNVNTCPVDRQVFRIILARHAGEQKIFKQFPVEDSQQETEEVEEDPTYCEVCGQADREDRLLLCDRCDLGYHCDCLDPPLASVPVHEWFCPDCQQSRVTVDPEHHGSGRQIARTRVSERVRRLIAEARAERAERRQRIADMITAQEALEGAEATNEPSVSATTSAATATRKKTTKTTRKRRTSKKRTVRKRKKTTKKRKTKRKSTGKKTKTRKRRSKGKGKRKVKKNKSASPASSTSFARTAISRAVATVKGRIADKLGLSKPPVGRSIPMQKLPPSGSRQEGAARSSADHGASALSILGSRDELYLFADQEGEERQPVSRPAISAEILLSRSARSSHKPLSFSPIKKKVVVKDSPTVSASASTASGGFDLLGSILQNQDLLYKGSKHVTINRDGSLTAANTGLSSRSSTQIRTTASTTSTQISSPGARNSTDSPTSSGSASPTSESKSATCTSPSKSLLPRSVSFSSDSVSSSDAPDNLETANEVRVVTQTTSSVSVETQSGKLPAVKDVRPGNKGEFLSDVLDSETKYSCLSMDISVDAMQDSGDAKLSAETEQCLLTSVDEVKHDDDGSNDNVYSSTASSGSTDTENRAEFNFADVRKMEQESKPVTTSESSSEGAENIKSNNSPSVGSRESDTVLNTIINGSPGQDTVDVKSGVDLEADAIFSNNARLNAEEDAGNNSIGFSTPTNSQTSLRNFAAVSSDLNSVHDDSSVGIMKRNFDILVSTSSNLVGYESAEENDNIEGFAQNPNDREEGEASDSEEDEIKDEDRQRAEEGHEEGEILDEEERERYPERQNTCADNEDSGGLDVNAIHIEEMEIGTFRKRSMSQNEDNNNEDSKKMKIDEGTTNGTEAKQESLQEEKDEEKSDEDNAHSRKPAGRSSFMLSSLLSSLKASDYEGAKCNDESSDGVAKKAEVKSQIVERQKVVRPKSVPDKKEEEDGTIKPFSILDFIGGDSAAKFGLEVDEIDKDRGEQETGHHRGFSSYSAGKSEPDKKEDDGTIKPFSILDFIGGDSAAKFGLEVDEIDKDRGDQETGYHRGYSSYSGGKSEPDKKEDDGTSKPFSILDFIGGGSAKKFGLEVEDERGDKDRGEQATGYHRGYSGFSSGNSYGRESKPNGDRRRNQWHRDRRAGDAEAGHENVEAVPARAFGRRRDSWQEDEKRSRDNRSSSQRSDSHEQRLSKSHHGRDSEKGHRRRDDESNERVVRSRSRSGSRSPRRKGEKRKKDKYHEDKNKHEKKRKSRWNQESDEQTEKEDGKQDMEVEQKKEKEVSKVEANGYPTNVAQEGRLVASEHYQSHQYPPAYPYARAPMPPLVRPPPHLPPQMHAHIPHPGLPFNHSASYGHPPYSHTHHGHSAQQVRPLHPGSQPHLQGFPPSYYPHPSGAPPRVPPPPPHSYPHAMFTGNARYPSQPAAPLVHPGAQTPATHPQSGYPRYPQPATHSYTQPVPPSTYPPRPAVPSAAVQPAVYTPATATTTTAAAAVYPQQQPHSASTTAAMPRYNYPVVATKQEPPVAHSVTSVKPESISVKSAAPLEPQKLSQKHSQKARDTVMGSPLKDVKPTRPRFPVSPPPAAPIKGISAYDKVDSSILLNEVKKGFRQLVEDAVRSALKGPWSFKKITKDEYKDIFKRAVEKVCGSKETVVHQEKIQLLVNAYVSKTRKLRKV